MQGRGCRRAAGGAVRSGNLMQEAFDICCDMNKILCAVQEVPVPFCIGNFQMYLCLFLSALMEKAHWNYARMIEKSLNIRI